MQLSRIRIGNLYGYKNEKDEIVISPQFIDAQASFTNGYAIVQIDNYCGIIEETGKFLLDCQYEEICPIKNGLFIVRVKKEQYDWAVGVIDINKKIVIDFNYKVIRKSQNSDFIVCYKNAQCDYSHSSYSHCKEYKYSKLTSPSWFNIEGEKIYEGDANAYGEYIIIGDRRNVIINKNGELLFDGSYVEIKYLFGHYFKAKKDCNEGSSYGVIDERGKLIIDFIYDEIDDGGNNAFVNGELKHCKGDYIRCISNKNEIVQANSEQRSDDKTIAWYNTTGKQLFEGEGIIEGDLLCIKKGTKWGAINIEGERILNYTYDKIISVGGYIVVSVEGKIGLLNYKGNLIISPIYIEIENVYIEKKVYDVLHGKKLYCSYSPDFKFDTEKIENAYYCRFQFRKYWPRFGELEVVELSKFEINHIFILRTDTYDELFTIEDGLLDNSRFDSIFAITNKCFVVKDNDLYGIYHTDVSKTIIPCEYERIIYEGDNVVLVQKNGLWGAMGIDVIVDNELLTQIPTEYNEIKNLYHLGLFGVKKSFENYSGKKEGYTIINRKGEPYIKIIDDYLLEHIIEDQDGTAYFESQFEYHTYSLVKTSLRGKWGFISLYGHISIPFKYDEVEERKDGKYNVRIGKAWGVMDLEGREIVAIKYKNKIPLPIENSIVVDIFSNYEGVLSESGKEKIPTIYNNILSSGQFFWVGYGSKPSHNAVPNFFSGYEYRLAIWGCIDMNGTKLVPVKYDCFKQLDNFILAGRDGSMLAEGQWGTDTYYESEYGGVYDLYSNDGSFLLGGFDKMEIDHNLLLFFLGGEWENNDYDGVSSFSYISNSGLCLVTDMNIRTILPLKNGKTCDFLGTSVKIRKTNENGKKIDYWNVPLELFIKDRPKVGNNFIIIKEKGMKFAIRLSDGAKTDPYEEMDNINEDMFFFRKDGLSGITTFEYILVKPDYSLLTIPINGLLFGIKREGNENCRVEIIDINGITERQPVIAISECEYRKMLPKVKRGELRIIRRDHDDGTNDLTIPNPDLFEKDFLNQYKLVKDKWLSYRNAEKYWFSNDLADVDASPDYSYMPDNEDYGRDTWDAMTDGMYGDYPGGDIDYEFLGE